MRSWTARLLLLGILLGGIVAIAQGRPAAPATSSQPALDALVGIVVGLMGTAAHEFGHAVALARYGRRARSAGFGFYWGAISFYVDSTEGLLLPRGKRVMQALAGLAVDCFTISALAIIAQLSSSVLVVSVAWRLVLFGLLELALNLIPLLELDGHWALADLLDEPDLAARARTALSTALRRRPAPTAPRWMVIYGASSILGGLALIAGAAGAFWYAAGDLVHALFAGNIAEIAVGVVFVLPFATSLLFSGIGLTLELIAADSAQSATPR